VAWRIDHLVVEGELDNTQLDWTIGWLQLEGIPDRLQLKLAGNCFPDLAGWRFRITRTDPEPIRDDRPDYSTIRRDQSGQVGDITADQVIKHFELPTDEVVRRLRNDEEVPFTFRKSLYLEWYSNANGRVVIQSTRLTVERLGERAFELTQEQWIEHQKQSQQEMEFFMLQLGDAIDSSNEPPSESTDD
jgi:hypothetical protein